VHECATAVCVAITGASRSTAYVVTVNTEGANLARSCGASIPVTKFDIKQIPSSLGHPHMTGLQQCRRSIPLAFPLQTISLLTFRVTEVSHTHLRWNLSPTRPFCMIWTRKLRISLPSPFQTLVLPRSNLASQIFRKTI
jgi:hypothetical protein